MRFLVLMAEEDSFAKWDAMTPAQQEADSACFQRFSTEVAARGELIAGDALDNPMSARTLQAGSAATRPATDGPFAETVEQLGGFFLVDLPDLDTAAARAHLISRRAGSKSQAQPATRIVGSCSTGKFTDEAMKHAAAASA